MADQFDGVESIAAVDTDNLREVLRRTMVMGLPSDDAEKPTFWTDRQATWTKQDNEGQPYDWTASPVSTEVPASSTQVICAYEFASPLGRQGAFQTEVGEFNPTTLVFTMFEDEFDEIVGFTYATLGPSSEKWFFRFWEPAVSLNDMTVYQVHCVAEGVD